MSAPAPAFTPATFADSLARQQHTFAPSHIGTHPTAYLPPASAARVRQLQLHVNDLHALCPKFDERKDALNARIEAENRVKRLVARAAEGGFSLPDDDPTVVAERKRLAELTAEAKRIDALYNTRLAAWQQASGVLANVTTWLRDGGMPTGTMLEVVETEPPKLNKGEGLVDAIERLRRRVRQLKADLARIAAAPFPSTYCKQRMREEIERLAQRGAPDVSPLIEHDGEIAWPTKRLTSQVIGGGQGTLAFSEIPEAAGLLAFALKESLIAALDREISAGSDDKSAMTHEARAKAEAEVQTDLLSVERDEATLIWQALEQRLPVEHRPDISIPALLGLRLITIPPATTAPGTSFERAMTLLMPGGR